MQKRNDLCQGMWTVLLGTSSPCHVVKDFTSTVQNLQWYRQYHRSKPEFLLYIFPNGVISENSPDRFTAEVHQDIKQVDLNISCAVETDSVVYYCALVPTVTGNTQHKTSRITLTHFHFRPSNVCTLSSHLMVIMTICNR